MKAPLPKVDLSRLADVIEELAEEASHLSFHFLTEYPHTKKNYVTAHKIAFIEETLSILQGHLGYTRYPLDVSNLTRDVATGLDGYFEQEIVQLGPTKRLRYRGKGAGADHKSGASGGTPPV